MQKSFFQLSIFQAASPMDTSLPGAVCHAPSTASSSSASDRLLSPTARASSDRQTPLSAEIGSPKFPQSAQVNNLSYLLQTGHSPKIETISEK